MEIVFLLFDRLTALDAIGPYEVLSRLPDAHVTFAAKLEKPVTTDDGFLKLCPSRAMAAVRKADVLVIPGGWGTRALETDEETLTWVRDLHQTTTWTTSVCTGSLVLGAAGLLRQRRATTHWAVLDLLRNHGASPVRERVVFDDKIVTAAGVSAGIDMALELSARIAGADVAQAIQLGIEYDPRPPFSSGSPETAPAPIVEMVRARLATRS